MRLFSSSLVRARIPRPYCSSSVQSPEAVCSSHCQAPIVPHFVKFFSVLHSEQQRIEVDEIRNVQYAVGRTEAEERRRPGESLEPDGGESERRAFQPWQVKRVHLNAWQHGAVAVGSALGTFMNPARVDLIASLGETMCTTAFPKILERMKRSAEGKNVLADRPVVTSSIMAELENMPSNTFGGAYAKFMKDRKFLADGRPPVRFIESEEVAYVATRYRQVHDFWHVLFNLPTNIQGEIALKAVEFYQTGLPSCAWIVAFGALKLKKQHLNYMLTHCAPLSPWALKAGSATDIMCIYYEQYLHEDLDELRKKWGIQLIQIFMPHQCQCEICF